MTIANLIAPGVTQVASADVAIAAGSTVTFSLMAAVTGSGFGSATAAIEYAGSTASTYFPLGALNAETPVRQVMGPITVRIVRRANVTPVGVDQNT